MEVKSPTATYTVLETISSKDLSRVFRCTSNVKEQPVVLKVIPKDPFLNINQVRKEIDILSKVKHPNIVNYIETFEDNSCFVIATEYFPGLTLFNYTHMKVARFSEDKARIIMTQIFDAVNYLHSSGISHRDLNFDNIMVDEALNIKILDFGAATDCINEYTLNPKNEFSCFDHPNVLLRKPSLAPMDDLWSLGVVLFTAASGKLPFAGSNPPEIVFNINSGNVLKPPGLSVTCYNLILKLLEHEDSHRYSASLALSHYWITNETNTMQRGGMMKPMCCTTRVAGSRHSDSAQVIRKPISQIVTSRIAGSSSKNITLPSKGCSMPLKPANSAIVAPPETFL